MDRVLELVKIEAECMQWLKDHPDADHVARKEVQLKLAEAIQEKNIISKNSK